mgnify:CR=1 FL=1
MKTVNNYYIKEKNVLLRADLNVPVINGLVTEKSRIVSIKSSIHKLIKGKNKIFLLSHFGRPKGIYNKKFSLEFICSTLAKEFEIEKIHFNKVFNDQDIEETINNMIKDKISSFIEFGPKSVLTNLNRTINSNLNCLSAEELIKKKSEKPKKTVKSSQKNKKIRKK